MPAVRRLYLSVMITFIMGRFDFWVSATVLDVFVSFCTFVSSFKSDQSVTNAPKAMHGQDFQSNLLFNLALLNTTT